MYIMSIFSFFFQGAVLWFIIVFVTQQHDLPWRSVALWLVLTVLAGVVGMLIAHYVFEAAFPFELMTALVLQLITLYGILRWQQISIRQTLIIIVSFIGFRVLWALPRLLQ